MSDFIQNPDSLRQRQAKRDTKEDSEGVTQGSLVISVLHLHTHFAHTKLSAPFSPDLEGHWFSVFQLSLFS